MSQYPSYQQCGTPWINRLPSHWTQCSLKHVIDDFVAGGTPSTSESSFWADGDTGTPWVAIGDMSNRDIVSGTAKSLTAAGLTDKRLSPLPAGSVLYSMYASVGFAAILNMPAVTNQAILGLVHNEEVDPRYLRAFLNAARPHVLREASSNTQDNLNAEKVKNLPFVLPPRDEQIAIASYLDAETARIDRLIEQKTTLLALVDEMHQSRVTEILQKGVRSGRTTYPTGDRRITRIPEGWNLVRWKHVGRFKAGAGFPVDLQGQVGKPYPFFKVKDISLADERGVMSSADSTVDDADASRLGAAILPADTIVFAKVGAALLLSRFRILACPGCIDNNMMGLTVDTDVALPRYVLHAISQFDLGDLANPGTVPSLNERQVRDLPIAMPPIDEQAEIAGELDRLADDAHGMRLHVTKEIDLLKELRSVTITDAVLGRIDVREHMKH